LIGFIESRNMLIVNMLCATAYARSSDPADSALDAREAF
jgi:hypothetical protein